jgi:Ser/Thr protein kinase RdoA (MazF antagonist)
MNDLIGNEFLADMVGRFSIPGDLVSVKAYGTGHINGSFASTVSQAGTIVRYLHQRINEGVFHKPLEVMENIARVLDHLRMKLAEEGRTDLSRRCMTIVKTRDGADFWVDGEGGCWRTYLFIEGSRSYDVIETPDQAFALGAAVGDFQSRLADLGGKRLHETIPNFHNARTRLAAFEEAVANDVAKRASSVAREIGYLREKSRGIDLIIREMEEGRIPERITHNDTKISNILMDAQTRESLCVIDLDTVMPGSALYDFGDLVRTCTISCAEDEPDDSKATLDLPMYEALARGYCSTARKFLNARERELLPTGGRIITLEQALRFLTDYLNGDTYYRIARPDHNLDRTRTQIALVSEMDAHWQELEGMTREALR